MHLHIFPSLLRSPFCRFQSMLNISRTWLSRAKKMASSPYESCHNLLQDSGCVHIGTKCRGMRCDRTLVKELAKQTYLPSQILTEQGRGSCGAHAENQAPGKGSQQSQYKLDLMDIHRLKQFVNKHSHNSILTEHVYPIFSISVLL